MYYFRQQDECITLDNKCIMRRDNIVIGKEAKSIPLSSLSIPHLFVLIFIIKTLLSLLP